MSDITAADESFHEPTLDDPWWSETHWFNFDQPGANLSATIYPFFRKNLSIAQLSVFLWDSSAHEPWLGRYGRAYWHLPYPATDLTGLRLEGLEYDCVEPFKTYRIRYREPGRVDLSLTYEALCAPHLAGRHAHGGHLDQPCRVSGMIQLDAERVEINCFGMRDKSWGPRNDRAADQAGAYSFGIASAEDHFILMQGFSFSKPDAPTHPPSGYLMRDGVKAAVVKGVRRVTHRRHGYPAALELELQDSLGRNLRVGGRCVNRIANQAFPAQFAWLSMTEWQASDGGLFIGEDQEVWSPDLLGPALARLNTD